MTRGLFSIYHLANAAGGHHSHNSTSICTSPNNVFTVQVDLFAGELGYFKFAECGDLVMPTIGLEVGETYTFVQADVTNYFHPLGFAYGPDGAHSGASELEPTVSSSDSRCDLDASCPAPMYFLDDEYLGTYSNIRHVTAVTKGEEDFGLDAYEPKFFHPILDWMSSGTFSIKLRFDDESYTQDLFYFCHIHQFMSGRIKLLRNGVPINDHNKPRLGYEYDQPGEFDSRCGTYDLVEYRLPNPQCPAAFVCGSENQDDRMKSIAPCYDAMNCAMFAAMTTGASSGSEVALFIHHMIPHHANAVNMAKNYLKSGGVKCDDLTDEENTECVMENLMRDIVNGQNHQIQLMRGILEDLNLPPEDDCVVEVSSHYAAGPP